MLGNYYIHKVTGKVWPERKLEREAEYRADELYKNIVMRENYAKKYNVNLNDEDNDGDYYSYCYQTAETAMMRFFKEAEEVKD